MPDTFAKRIGGALCLDFVNTVQGRVDRAGRPRRNYADIVVGERLGSYDVLLRWAAQAGAVTGAGAAALARRARARPEAASAVHVRAIVLREAMYRVFKAVLERWTPEPADLAAVNREVLIARSHERLAAAPRPRWEWDDDEALDRVLWPVVRSAAELLTSADLSRVRQCPGPGCGWLFADTSRSGRRQWCDMADCGNAAKVRRFRARHRAAR